MESTIRNQVAIVTGGCSGLGQAISMRLAAQGVQVIVFDVQNPKAPQLGIVYMQLDLTVQAEVQNAVRAVAEKWKYIDILINSAGITGKTNLKTHETDPDDVAKVMQVNFTASYLTSRAVLPYMVEQDYGRILHIASIAGKEGNAGMLAYSASKAAVIGMTKVQGKEYATTGITINALAPAVIRTPLVDAMPEEQVRYMTDKIPAKRCGTLDEAADMALFIVSKANSFCTGFTFDLSGGRATY